MRKYLTLLIGFSCAFCLLSTSEALDVDESPKNTHQKYSQDLVKNAEAGNELSQLNLGDLYERGDGVDENLNEAARWYEKAADQGNAKAKFFLGRMYYTGKGVKKDTEKAKNLWEKGAEQGDMWCQYSLGMVFQNKAGVVTFIGTNRMFLPSPNSSQNLHEAEKWYSKSAAQGFQPSINALKEIAETQKEKAQPQK